MPTLHSKRFQDDPVPKITEPVSPLLVAVSPVEPPSPTLDGPSGRVVGVKDYAREMLQARVSQLSALAIQLRDEMCAENACAPMEINSGLCEDWALELVDRARADGLKGVHEFDIANFWALDQNGETCTWGECGFKILALRDYGMLNLPNDLTEADLLGSEFAMSTGVHVWAYDPVTRLHFDAEATEGVVAPLDLPIYRRAAERFVKAKLE